MTVSLPPWRRMRALFALSAFLVVADFAASRAAAAQVEIFEHAQFRGRRLTVGGVVANLRDHGFNDRASSIRPVRGNRGGDWGGRNRGWK